MTALVRALSRSIVFARALLAALLGLLLLTALPVAWLIRGRSLLTGLLLIRLIHDALLLIRRQGTSSAFAMPT